VNRNELSTSDLGVLLRRELRQALGAYDETDRKHRTALDQFVTLVRTRPVDLVACQTAERLAGYTRADREVAATLAIKCARAILDYAEGGAGEERTS
jgi:peroxiredoxin family protein